MNHYQDRMTKAFLDRVVASAEKRFGRKPHWFKASFRSTYTGNGYTLERLGIDDDRGQCTHVAYVNRAGAVQWCQASALEEWQRVEVST